MNKLEALVSSCGEQLDSRCLSGNSPYYFSAPLVKIQQTFSQITFELNNLGPLAEDDKKSKRFERIFYKLHEIYRCAYEEEVCQSKYSLIDRIMQTFYSIIIAPFWFTLCPDWAVLADMREKTLPEFLEAFGGHLFGLSDKSLLAPLMEKCNRHCWSLIESVPESDRVSVFRVFLKFKEQSIEGFESSIIRGLRSIPAEERESVASSIAFYWTPGVRPSKSPSPMFPHDLFEKAAMYAIENLFQAVSRVDPVDRPTFCEKLQFLIKKNKRSFSGVSRINEINYRIVGCFLECLLELDFVHLLRKPTGNIDLNNTNNQDCTAVVFNRLSHSTLSILHEFHSILPHNRFLRSAMDICRLQEARTDCMAKGWENRIREMCKVEWKSPAKIQNSLVIFDQSRTNIQSLDELFLRILKSPEFGKRCRESNRQHKYDVDAGNFNFNFMYDLFSPETPSTLEEFKEDLMELIGRFETPEVPEKLGFVWRQFAFRHHQDRPSLHPPGLTSKEVYDRFIKASNAKEAYEKAYEEALAPVV